MKVVTESHARKPGGWIVCLYCIHSEHGSRLLVWQRMVNTLPQLRIALLAARDQRAKLLRRAS